MSPGSGKTVALFATCINDTMKPSIPIATVTVLERLGCRVVYPPRQTCCGQIMTNTGYWKEALPTVRNYVSSFGDYDYVVGPSGSCVGSVRHQHEMLARHAGDEPLAEDAKAVASRSYELSEFLIDVLGVTDVGAYFPHRVTYHPTCHSLRIAKVGDKPYRLLREVEGLQLIDLPEATSCCGFGGTFSMKNAQVSTAMLADKMANVMSTKAEVLVAGDYSCLMHIAGGMSRTRSGVRAMHLAEVLAGTREEPWEAPATTTKVGA